MTDINRILRIDASARKEGSVTRKLGNSVVDRFSELGAITLTTLDVSEGLPFVDQAWVEANFTPADSRTPAQVNTLAFSDARVEELKNADTIIINTPIYNFGIPATLKAWIDMVARAGLTFKYTENGPVGLLEGKSAIVTVASGGTQVGSPIDFATPYLKHALGFIGIHDVTIITADALSKQADEAIQRAQNKIKELA